MNIALKKNKVLICFCFFYWMQGLVGSEGRKNLKLYRQFMYEPILDLFGRCDDLFIPLILTEDFHYTLLHFNKQACQWIHYNPMRGKKPETTKGFQNAMKVVS